MSGSKPGRQSLFFRDLASPVSSAHRGAASRFATPGQAAAVSALWREGLAGVDPPPPPVFTLDDRADFSPEPAFPASPRSPTAPPSSLSNYSPSPFRIRTVGGSGGSSQVAQQQPQQQSSGPNVSWWSPARAGERDEKGKGSPGSSGSPVNGVVQPGALITLPPPREVARPEMQRSSMPTGGLDEEEWITVYGFSPGDTNLVLREFEKCGVILKHIPGPRDANWVHILYQNRYDAQKALQKNGMQVNSVLIVGVKPIDPMQRQILNEKMDPTNRGFMVSLPSKSPNGRSSAAFSPLGAASPSPYYLQASTKSTRDSSSGAIASPAKSVISKVMDLMFGI